MSNESSSNCMPNDLLALSPLIALAVVFSGSIILGMYGNIDTNGPVVHGTNNTELNAEESISHIDIIENVTVPVIAVNESDEVLSGLSIDNLGPSVMVNDSEIAGLELVGRPMREATEPLDLKDDPAFRAAPSNASFGAKEVKEFDLNRTSSVQAGIAARSSPTILEKFEGLNAYQGRRTPPDPTIAVSPNHVVQMVNLAGQITSRDGRLLMEFILEPFFLPQVGDRVHDISDPILLYDQSSKRFFASILDKTEGSVRVAFTNEDDPTLGWTVRKLMFSQDGDLCPDQPYMAVSSDKIGIGANMWSRHCNKEAGTTYQGTQHFIVGKNELLNNQIQRGAITPLDKGDALRPAFSERPVKLTGAGGDDLFFVSVANGNTIKDLKVIKYSGKLPDVTRTVYSVGIRQIDHPPDASQPNTNIKLDTDGRLQSASMSADNKFFWVTSMERCKPPNDREDRSCIRLIQINATAVTSLFSDSVMQDLTIGSRGLDLFYPALTVTSSDDMILISAVSSNSMNPSIIASGQASDVGPLGSVLQPTIVLPGGQVNVASRENIARYGDYFGASVDSDPSDKNAAWFTGQYMRSPTHWGTVILKLGR